MSAAGSASMQIPAHAALLDELSGLADAVDALERDGYAVPWLGGAAARSGEVARLAAQLERLTARLAEQVGRAERLVRQRRELMTQVSHDLRTPLASIQGYLELLLLRHASLDAAERQGYLETAAHQSERLGRLVDDLFQLAELDGDAYAPSTELFSLAELVQDVVLKFAPDAQRRRMDGQSVRVPAPELD